MQKEALDVSSNNHAAQPFNWQEAFAAGFRIAYIKATQGVHYLNPYFIQDCRDAKNAGFKVGIYHFLDGTTPNDQASWFVTNGVNQVKEYTTLLPVCDYETGTPTAEHLRKFTTDVKCGVYVNKYFFNTVGSVECSFWWLAIPSWDGSPPVPANVAMVQTGSEMINGISSPNLPTDCSVVLDMEAMNMNANNPAPKVLNAPIVGGVALPNGKGYWLVGADGGVFSFGEAQAYGSMAGQPLNKPIVGIMSSPTGLGFCLIGADGGTFCYGDFVDNGSLPGLGYQPAP